MSSSPAAAAVMGYDDSLQTGNYLNEPAHKEAENLTYFRFCHECSNLLYPKVDPESQTLMDFCQTCHTTQAAVSNCVFQNKVNSLLGATAGFTKDVTSDPTVAFGPHLSSGSSFYFPMKRLTDFKYVMHSFPGLEQDVQTALQRRAIPSLIDQNACIVTERHRRTIWPIDLCSCPHNNSMSNISSAHSIRNAAGTFRTEVALFLNDADDSIACDRDRREMRH
ncbi:hypothetical protein KEM54_005670 [Ascosphaera aggregata]|nr:hypothetical protein KEM54_005670 [Ascosphaera aggregata]